MFLNKRLTLIIILFSCAVSYGYETKPLNIFFIVGHFPCRSQTFVLNIITSLIDMGHNVSIFSFHKNDLLFVHPNIEKYKLLDHVIYEKFPSELPECDIVFCQFGYLGEKIFRMSKLAQWLSTKKVAVCFRGSDITAHIQEDVKMYNRMFKRADLFLPVCDYFRKKLIALGCDASKIAVYHSAIDCSQFFFEVKQKPKNDIIRLVSTCRLVKKKGLDHAIRAVADVVKRYPQIHYTIIGDGPEYKYLKSLVRQLNLQDKVTLCGWKSQDEIVSILNKSHIFLLPSRTAPDGNEEGIPNALKEAMAMGLITVGSWHAGTPELIDHGVSGFLVSEKSLFDLTYTIQHIIDHPGIWESIGRAARKKIEDEFETKQCVEKLEKLFYKLLGQ